MCDYLIMLCINERCGIQKTNDSEYCFDCNEIIKLKNLRDKLKNNHNHKNNYIKNCKECCSLNKIINSKVCCNCGKKDLHRNHRLCTDCVYYTLPCKFCNGMNRSIEIYVKVCLECINLTDNRECIYVECSNERINNSFVCKSHMCDNEGCLNIKSGSGINKYFCENCVCECCSDLKINNSYCRKHTCKYDGCDNCINYNNIEVCNKHICGYVKSRFSDYYECSDIVVRLGKNCEKHTCKYKNCINAVKNEDFCVKHSCNVSYCSEPKYENKLYCIGHTCIIDYCNSSTYSCNKYKIPEVKCSNWHIKKEKGYKNCDMMILSKTISQHYAVIDRKLLWKQIYKFNNDFYNAFLKSGYSLLSVLRVNNIFKDIRKKIFYEYLISTIRYYFDDKCYNCTMICSKETCGMVGLPYNPDCKKHVCSQKDCKKLKYKDLNICKEHKCKFCVKVVQDGSTYCSKHLCPYCEKNCIADGYNFCRKCRCHKRIKNNYGTVKCKKAIHPYGEKRFCFEHYNVIDDTL